MSPLFNPQEIEFKREDVYLYNFPENSKIYMEEDNNICYLGITTGYTSIAHNGISHGNLNVKKGVTNNWISGYVIGYYEDGFLFEKR